MTDISILRELASIPTPVLTAAHQGLGYAPRNGRGDIIKDLGDAVEKGHISVAQIKSTTPAAAHAVGRAAVIDAAAAHAAGRAEAVALDALSRVNKVQENLAGLNGVVGKAVETLESLRQSTDQALAAAQARVTQSEIDAAASAAVREAFAPLRKVIEEQGKQEQALDVMAAPVRRAPASEVFGIEVTDASGSDLMVDIWNDPDAPAIDPHFIWTADILRVLILAQDTGANVWFGGEKGTGKTQTAEQFAARTGRAFNRVNFHKYSAAESFMGGTGLEAGQTKFALGEFTGVFCTRPGSINLLDEPTNADPGEMAQFNALLEPAGRVNLGGQNRSRAKGALVFAADNTMGAGDVSGRYVGTRIQNAALLDRFAYKVPFTFLPIHQEVQALVKHTGCSEALGHEVMQVITTARAKVQTGDLVDAPSIRQAIAWIKAMRVLGVRRAWEVTVAASQPAESALAVEAIYTAEVDEARVSSLL